MIPAPVTCRWVGVALVILPALIRAMSVPADLPWWDIDPLIQGPVEAGLTPLLGFTLDILTWLGAACIIINVHRERQRIRWVLGLLVAAGWYGVIFRGLLLADKPFLDTELDVPGDWQSWVTGSAWASAMVGGWAILHAARDLAVRRLLAVVIAGFALMFVARGTFQVLIEHPELVSQFDDNPQEALHAAGLTPGSAAALIYERRLRHPDATGWFVFSNVYGGHAAAALALLLPLIFASWRRHLAGHVQNGEPALLGLLTLAVAWGLWIAHSKGAIGAMVIGGAVVLLLAHSRVCARFHPRASWIAPLLMAGVLTLVVIRGFIGERIGELSLLFRWFYMEGAAKAFLLDPFFGVGPARFKEAYLLTRPALSPEEVASPHSVFFDWLATLGVMGVAWIAALIALSALAGRAVCDGAEAGDDHGTLRAWWIGALIAGIATVAALVIETDTLNAGQAITSLIGFVAWMAVIRIGWDVAADSWRTLRLGVLGAALILLIHGQIEMIFTVTGSAALALILVALAAAEGARQPRASASRLPLIVALCICLASIDTLALKGIIPARHRQAALHDMAEAWHNLVVSRRLTTGDVGDPALEAAFARLEASPDAWDQEPRLKMVDLHLARAAACASAGERELATAVLLRVVPLLGEPLTVEAAARSARLSQMMADLEPNELQREFLLQSAIARWMWIEALDPQGLTPHVRQYELYRRMMTHGDQAVVHARRALEIDANRRFDPLTRLPDALRAEMEAFLASHPEVPAGQPEPAPEPPNRW